MEKKTIRDNILNKRSQIKEDEHRRLSQKVIYNLMNSSFYKDANNIMTFVSYIDEIDTHEFIKLGIKDNKNISIPITLSKTKELKPSIIKDFNKELELGHYNILTPKKEYIRYIQPENLDLIIVPTVAFDREGYRVGYGGGYYDRFLAPLKNITTIGISFDMQIIDKIPRDDYDIAVDYICTEKGIFPCK